MSASARAPAGDVALRADEVSRHAARLVVIDRARPPALATFAALPALLAPGDVVVVNDAATLPASLRGTSGGADFEVRLSGPIERDRIVRGVLFDAGDHRTRTEERGPPPPIALGARVALAGLPARLVARLDARRAVFELESRDPDRVWAAIYAAGAPIQYAHRAARLPLHAVQTAYAGRPWAVEMPSAGRGLTWDVLLGLRRRGIAVVALTHAAGLSSTGDAALDAALPWPERYAIPEATARAIADARARGGRVIAIGTTVVRALEASGGVAGEGVAVLRLEPRSRLRVVDGVVSGLHAPGESHFELLGAFAPRAALLAGLALARAHDLSAHELGDACLVSAWP